MCRIIVPEVSMNREERERARKEPHPFDLEQARPALARFLTGKPEAKAAFLFGSRAHGRVRPSSDVDIAIWMDPAIPEPQRWDLSLAWTNPICKAIGYEGEIDVIALNDAPLPLAWDVAQRPVVLYEAEPELAGAVAASIRREFRDEEVRLQRRRARLLDRIRRGEFGVRRSAR